MEKTLRSSLSLCVVPAHCARASPGLEWGRGWESGPAQGEVPPLPGEVTSDSHFRAKFVIFISACPRPACLLWRHWGKRLLLGQRAGFSGEIWESWELRHLKFRGHRAVHGPHVALKSQSSVCVHCLWMCIPLKCMSRVWVRVDSKKSALARCRQSPVQEESSNLLSIRWSVSQRGLTEQ